MAWLREWNRSLAIQQQASLNMFLKRYPLEAKTAPKSLVWKLDIKRHSINIFEIAQPLKRQSRLQQTTYFSGE